MLIPMHTPIILPKCKSFMKKRSFALFLFLFALLGAGPLTAQNAAYTLHFEQPDTLPCVGEEFCIDLTVENFTDILETRFNVVWDSTVIEFVGVGNVIDELASTQFTQLDGGTLNVNWQEGGCALDNPAPDQVVTLDDCAGECRPAIYTLCFRAISSYGDATELSVADIPTPFAAKPTSFVEECTNVFLIPKPAVVSTCVRPLLLDISSTQGNAGDLVCVDFYASGVDSLSSFQFPIVWDSTLATYENIIVAGNLPNLSTANFGVPGSAQVSANTVTVAWDAPPPNSVESLPDSTLIFQLCLRLEDDACGRDFEVFVADEQPDRPGFVPLATNDFEGGFGDIAVGNNPGIVDIGACDPEGIKLSANCGPPRELNEEFCVQVRAGDNFQDVTDLQFLMEWNPNILEFTGVSGFNLPGLNATNFNDINAPNGILNVEWEGGAQSRADEEVLFEVCFRVVGLGGSSPFRFINNDNDVGIINNDDDNNIGINPENCEVAIDQPDGLVIETTDGLEGRPGDTLCFDFTVSNFVEMQEIDFSIAWEVANLEFILSPPAIENLNGDAGIDLTNFNIIPAASGGMTFEWDSATPVTLPDGDTLFTLCFVVPEDADPGTCDFLQFTNQPLSQKVVTASSNGEDVGLTGVDGEFCVLSPEGFWLVPDNVSGDLRDTLCVPFKVGEFDGITEAQFDINWAPGSLELVDINDPGTVPGLNVNTSGFPVGTAQFDFTDAAGLSLMDSTVIFEMCFELIGPADTCYTLDVGDDSVVGTTNGEGSLLYQPSEICIDNKIFIDSIQVTEETCPGTEDGSVRLFVSGGNPQVQGGYGFSWQNPTRVSNPAENLPSGEVIVTVFDGTGLSVTDTIMVPAGGTELSVSLPPDQTANCDCAADPNIIFPTVSSSSPLDELKYQWTATGGGQVAGPADERITSLCGEGTYTIEVEDPNGCTESDEIILTPPTLPAIAFNPAEPDDITCASSEVILGVEEVANGGYSWEGPGGFSAASPDVMVQDSGTYVVTVEFTDTRCTNTDSVTVDVDTLAPVTIASPGLDTVPIGCADDATLEGFAGDDTSDITVRWLNEAGTQLTTDFNYTTNAPGIYIFEAIDTTTGCLGVDTTVVAQDDALPTVDIIDDPAIACDLEPVELTTTVTNANPDGLTIEWTTDNGGSLVPGTENLLSPLAETAGTYTIDITVNATGCTASDIVEVALDTLPIAASAEVIGQIDCNSETAILDATGSAEGPDVTYSWFNPNLGQLDTFLFNLPVGAPGDYTLTVRDTATGCFNRDTVTVLQDTLPPSFTLGPGQTLNCDQDTLAIAANVDLPLSDFTVTWEGDAPIAGFVNDTVVAIDQPGNYDVIVQNTVTGCADTLSRTITEDRDEPEIVLAEDSLFINCFDNAVVLDATGSTQSDSNTTVQYSWAAIEGNALPPFNEQTLEVEEGGVFVLTLTNVVSNCSVQDTAVVTADTEAPEAVTVNPQNIDLSCTDNEAVLDGTGSATGDNIVYIWQQLEAGNTVVDTIAMGPDEITTTVTNPGIYQLRVFNTENGCFSTSGQTQVELVGGEPPQIVFGAPTDVGVIDYTCESPDTVSVALSIANDSLFQQSDLVFEWSGGEVITDDMDPYTVGVTGPGIYTIMITDTSSSCAGENELVVNDARVFPEVALAEDSLSLDCDSETASLEGFPFAEGDTIVYQWQDEAGAMLTMDSTLEISEPGTYFFMVENTNSGCTAMDSARVQQDTAAPAILTEVPEAFQCDSESVLLSAAPSGDAADFDLVWQSVNGGAVSPNAGTLTANVDAPGTYELTLTSLENGCDSTALFEVAADTMPPMGMIAEPSLLGCEGQTVTLDASSFGNNGDFEIEWSSQGGGNVSPPTGSFLVDVDAAGTYELSVTNPDNGCEATPSVTVELDPNAPMAVGTTADNMLGCGDTLTLDGTGSSEGMEFDYEWIVVDGNGTTPIPLTNFTATVDAVGDYAFIVTNMDNGCSDTSEVVSIVLDDDLPMATATIDSVGCDGTAFISGNLPAGTEGTWTSAGSATIADVKASMTTVSNLVPGGNELTWSLSQEGCPDFSTASINVEPELAPVAVDDVLNIPQGSNGANINILSNDDLTGVSEYNITITEEPSIGSLVDNGEGLFGYGLDITLFAPAEDGFAYEICNANCPTLCDEAMVEIQVERDTTGEVVVPNGITPNGDGMNDQLIFDQLLLNPDEFENNSLVIFNRWGDIVFEAAPYNNDWEGTNSDGSPLPDGTYYYILRLEIGSGNILRGDITIIR